MTIGLFEQGFAVVSWLFLLILFQIAVWPVLKRWNEQYAIPLSFPISLLLSTLISWYLALFHLPVPLMLVLYLVLIIYYIWKRSITISGLIAGKTWYFIFIGAFLLALGIKLAYNPSIDISYEKFMDSMILSSMIHNLQIPPLDGWYSGGTLTWYYYLSAWMFAVPASLLSISPSLAYNLAVPTVFAISAVMIWASSCQILTRFRFLPLLMLFISYPAFFSIMQLAIVEKIPLRLILDGTVRALPGAITENPLSSLFIGSPRPYAVGLIIQCTLIFLAIFIFKNWSDLNQRSRIGLILICSLSLGTSIPLHSWDFLVYLPLYVLLGIIISFGSWRSEAIFSVDKKSFSLVFEWARYIKKKISYPKDFFSNAPVSAILSLSLFTPILSVLLYFPFIFQMDNQRMEGITFYPFSSDLLPFLMIHGFFLLIAIWYVGSDIRKKPQYLLVPALLVIAGYSAAGITLIPVIYLLIRKFENIEELFAFIGFCCILFCEFFAMVENGSPFRENTTYKFYFIAWVLLGFSIMIMLGKFLSSWKYVQNPSGRKLVSLVIIGITLLFPLILLSGGPLWSPTLDGTAYTSTYVGPEEEHAINYLLSLSPEEIIVEGMIPVSFDQDETGKYFSRISTFTGIPAVMGSYFREEVYRGTDAVKQRAEDVIIIYKKPEQASSLMKKNNASLLYVGIPEISLYQITDPDIYLQYGFTPVFSEGNTTIWRPPE